MKNYLLLGALPLMIASCNNEETLLSGSSEPIVSKSNVPTGVYLKDGKILKNLSRAEITDDMELALSFPNQEALDNYLETTIIMPPMDSVPAGQIIIPTYGSILTSFENKLDSLADNCPDEQTFKALYDVMSAEYDGKLVRNNIWTSDLSMYLPGGVEEEMFYVANTNGNYVVDDSIHNIFPTESVSLQLSNFDQETSLMFQEFDTTHSSGNNNGNVGNGNSSNNEWESTPPYYGDLNKFRDLPKRDKRVLFRAERKKNIVKIKFFAKRKKWTGFWVNDPHRTYAIEPHIRGLFDYLCYPPGPYTTERLTKKTKVWKLDLAKIRKDNYYIGGTIKTWTDLTADKDYKGDYIYTIDNFGNKIYQFSDENAKVVDISL